VSDTNIPALKIVKNWKSCGLTHGFYARNFRKKHSVFLFSVVEEFSHDFRMKVQKRRGVVKMKNTIKFLGIIALVAVIGFGFVSCGGDDGGGGDGGGDGSRVQIKSIEGTENGRIVLELINYNTTSVGTTYSSDFKVYINDEEVTPNDISANLSGQSADKIRYKITFFCYTSSFTANTNYKIKVVYTANAERKIPEITKDGTEIAGKFLGDFTVEKTLKPTTY
jgi:hypothetical protein